MKKALLYLRIYYVWENIKSLYNNNKFEISSPSWNGKFELSEELYSVSDIQDYFEYIIWQFIRNFTNKFHTFKDI